MSSFDYDFRYLQAGLEDLEQYLLSGEIFWNLTTPAPRGEPEYPRLTLGSLLLARARLEARQLTIAQQAQVADVILHVDAVRTRWRVAWEQKAQRSFGVRLRMWRDFIEEYRESPGANVDRYSYEVRLRVMLHLLREESHLQNKAEVDLLNSLDAYLKVNLNPGKFIWESEIQAGFPPDVYWYLYGNLSENIR